MFLLNKRIPMGTEDAPTAGVLRMSVSTVQCCRPRPVSLPVPPVNLAICPDTAQFHVQEEPFLSSYTFNHIHSFRSFMKFRCCGMNFEHNKHKYLPSNAYMDPWVQLKLSSRCGGPSQELICPLLCPTAVQDDATESVTKANSRRRPFQKTSRTFIMTVYL